METVERDEIIKIFDKLNALNEWLEHMEKLVYEVNLSLRDTIDNADLAIEINEAINNYRREMNK